MGAKILIVDDEPAIREMIRFALARGGFDHLEAGSAEEALEVLGQQTPALILLDWMLPGRSGLDFARSLKSDFRFRELPIIMLTAKDSDDDTVRGLEAGADDYVAKPFSPSQLLARVRAVLRRVSAAALQPKLELRGLELDPESHRVTANGNTVKLGPTEYKLLFFLMSHPDRVYSRSRLIDQVWGTLAYVEERTVDVHVRRLRRALEPSGHQDLVQTVRGAGYRLSETR